MKILMDIFEVEKDVKRLYKDRQVHVNVINVIIVGVA